MILLPDFKQAKVLVVGDIMLDRYWQGKASRISPEAPVPVVNIKQEDQRAGGAANVAVNAAILGAQTKVIGFIGCDSPGNFLIKTMTEIGVNCCFCIDEIRPTIVKLRVISHHQHLLRMDFEENFTQANHQQLLTRCKKELKQVPVLILSDYHKGTLEQVHKIIELARHEGIKVLVDPKGSCFQKYSYATLLTPNFQEFCHIVGPIDNEQDLIKKGFQLIEKLHLEALLITRSEQGMTLLHRKSQVLHIPAQAQEVFDVTGAGDTVIATLGAALAAGETLESACVLANQAAGIVVGKLGTATVSPLELEACVVHEMGTGVVNTSQLFAMLALARNKGEKIVMTNGCFDILHGGHVAYLEAARKLGDRLIVAVNTDDSVRRLKGIGRPINDVARRMEVLAGLAAVDWVVPFDEDTPMQLIEKIQPDILVKGGDYEIDQIAGAQMVLNNGGQVHVLQFKQGYSTTRIIDTIKGENSLSYDEQ